MVKEILGTLGHSEFRIQRSAIEALQEAAEAILVSEFESMSTSTIKSTINQLIQ